MKVLMVTPANVPDHFKRFLTTLRADIGTCEHLSLAQSLPYTAQKKLFESYLYSMSFDRHVLCYQDSQGLIARLQLFAGLKELTLLSLQQETHEHRKIIRTYAATVPWLRWAGSDEYSFTVYQRSGIDAHLLPPMVTVTCQVKGASLRPVRCHVIGNSDAHHAVQLPPKADFYVSPQPEESVLTYVTTQVVSGDIVLFQERSALERHVVAESMAAGALVVAPSAVITSGKIDALVRSACVSVDSTAELFSLFNQIRTQTFAELLSRSLAKAQLFSPEAVARVLARLLAQTGRDQATFRARSNWL